MLGSGIVGEDAFRIPDRFADRFVGQITFGPQASHQSLRHLAGIDREIVHELSLLAKLLHDLIAFRADGIDRQAEGEADCIVGHCLHQRDHLACVDKGKGARKDIDPAAPRTRSWQLQIGDIGRLLRKSRPHIAQTIVACGLAFEGGRTSDVGRRAHIIHEAVHAVADICRKRRGYHAGSSKAERSVSDASNHVRLPLR